MPNPKLETLQDNFNDNDIDPTKWTTEVWDATIQEINGNLECTVDVSEGQWYVFSVNNYDFTDSYGFLKIVDPGNVVSVSNAFNFSVGFYVPGDTYSAEWGINNGEINANYYFFEGANDKYETYDEDVYRYLRIRNSTGVVYWDYSSDGVSWNNYFSVETESDLTECWVAIDAYSITLPDTKKLDDFNIAVGAFTKTFTETLTVTDLKNNIMARVFSDTSTLTEIFSKIKGIFRTFIDNITTSDIFSRIRQVIRNFLDNTGLSEIFNKVFKVKVIIEPIPDSIFTSNLDYKTLLTNTTYGKERRRNKWVIPKHSFILQFNEMDIIDLTKLRNSFRDYSNLKSFSWDNPVDSITYTVRFVEDYFKVDYIGRDRYNVTINLVEVL